MTNGSFLLVLGGANAFLAVALGAFGAHGLQEIISPRELQTWQTAVDYHGFHALGLLIIGILAQSIQKIERAGWWIFAGILLFSGSLYMLSLTGIKTLGMITPVGGVCFLIGWSLVTWTTFQHHRNS